MAHVQPYVAPTNRSTKGSWAAPIGSREDIGEISQCELLLPLGKVFKGTTTLHNVVLPLNVVKVRVKKVKKAFIA